MEFENEFKREAQQIDDSAVKMQAKLEESQSISKEDSRVENL